MNSQFRLKSLVYIVLITIGILILAGSLSTMRFKPALPIPGAETTLTSNNPVNEPSKTAVDFRLLFQLPVAIILLLIIFLVISALVKKKYSVRIIKISIGLIIGLCIVVILNQMNFTLPASSIGEPQEIVLKPPLPIHTAPIGIPPTEIFWFVIIALIIGTAIMVFWFLFRVVHQTHSNDLIANEADAALKEIKSGSDLRNTIVRCYTQMLSIVEEEQGIKRSTSVTPREFESILTAKGIPISSIHRLTILFEKVRYGSKPTNLSDENAAIECLTVIRKIIVSRDKNSK